MLFGLRWFTKLILSLQLDRAVFTQLVDWKCPSYRNWMQSLPHLALWEVQRGVMEMTQ